MNQVEKDAVIQAKPGMENTWMQKDLPLRNTSERETEMEAPIRYARSGEVHIAYRVFGDGPRDIVLIPGTHSVVSFPQRLRRLCFYPWRIVFAAKGNRQKSIRLINPSGDNR